MHQQHPKLPNNTTVLCSICFDFGVKEENEISRHFKKDHPQHTQYHGKTPYDQCRRVTERIAAELLGQPRIANLNAKQYSGVKNNPRAPLANSADVDALFARRNLPVPNWVANEAFAAGNQTTIPAQSPQP